jgi:hypothetical protein
MHRRLSFLLAVFLACSTVLAGVPLITASAASDPHAGPCVAPLPFDPEALSEARGETVEEEREEKQESGDSDIDLFTGPWSDAVLDMRRGGLLTLDSSQAATGSFAWGHSIRGPPVG